MQQAVFRPAGHNAVGFLRPLGHQIVNEGADVAGVPGEDQREPTLNFQCGVDAGHQSLRGGFLVAGGAVELPRAVQAGNQFGFQCWLQLGGIDALVFDGIGGAHHFRVLQPRHGAQHGKLHILGKTGRKALNVHFLGVQPAGFDEQLVPGLVGKADDLRLDAGAVPGADAGDGAIIHGTAVQVLPDDAVGLLVGVGQVAHGGIVDLVGGAEGKRLRRLVPRLHLHFGKIDAPPVDTGWRAGFEAAKVQPEHAQIIRQSHTGVHPVGTGGDDALAGDDGAVQVRSRGDDHGFRAVLRPQLSAHAGDGAVRSQNFHDLRLFQLQIFLQFQNVLHILPVFYPIGLSAEGMDGGAFAPVEHPVLDAGMVSRRAHLAPQRVQLPHKVPLSGAADGGVAGHISNGVQIDGKENGVIAQPGGGKGGFDSRVSRPDHGNVTAARVIAHNGSSCGKKGVTPLPVPLSAFSPPGGGQRACTRSHTG